MALSFTSNLHAGTRHYKQEGLLTAIVEMTTSLGSDSADYSSGFDIQGNAAKFGMSRVVAVLVAGAREADATVMGLAWNWNPVTGKLQAYADVVGAAAAEVTTAITAGSIVRMVIYGN